MLGEVDLVARVAELERLLAARQQTIEVLMDRVEERLAAPSSALAVLQQSIALEHAVTSKTRELAKQRGELAEALRALQMTQAELTQSHKLSAIGQLASGVAHEINTPIQYVGDNLAFLERVFAQVLPLLESAVEASSGDAGAVVQLRERVVHARVPRLIAQVPRALTQSREGIERVAHIVAAMKTFSHPCKGEKSEFRLRDAVESTVAIARNEWKYVADVDIHIPSDLPNAYGMRDELNQVVLNLVVNAAHAIAEVAEAHGAQRGHIVITAASYANGLEIRLADTGGGIPEAARGRVFDPFFTTKAVGKGTGQGLAIAHNVVVERHGGTIAFETELGVGTTFVIRLPGRPRASEGAT